MLKQRKPVTHVTDSLTHVHIVAIKLLCHQVSKVDAHCLTEQEGAIVSDLHACRNHMRSHTRVSQVTGDATLGILTGNRLSHHTQHKLSYTRRQYMERWQRISEHGQSH